MQALESRLGGWVIAARWPIIAAALILVGVAASGTLLLDFSADHRAYFSEDNPQLLAFEAMENTYGKSGNVFFAIVPEDRDATSALALEATAWLTEQAWQIPYSTRVDSITNFQHTTADGDDILVRDLVDEAMPSATPASGPGFAQSRSPNRVSRGASSRATAESAASTSPWSCRARTKRPKVRGSPSSCATSRTRCANASPASTCG